MSQDIKVNINVEREELINLIEFNRNKYLLNNQEAEILTKTYYTNKLGNDLVNSTHHYNTSIQYLMRCEELEEVLKVFESIKEVL